MMSATLEKLKEAMSLQLKGQLADANHLLGLIRSEQDANEEAIEDACLNFHETERVVKTASFLQVRPPIYKTSRNRWRNYAAHLGDVARILGVSIDPVGSLNNGSAT
jgi:hypothetical protein